MRLFFLNNDGAGFADHVEVADGTTIKEFLEERLDGDPADYLIRVNRQPVAQDQVLQPGDRVSATPTKIEGAGC
jgi:sulfur carrier protein ThiS